MKKTAYLTILLIALLSTACSRKSSEIDKLPEVVEENNQFKEDKVEEKNGEDSSKGELVEIEEEIKIEKSKEEVQESNEEEVEFENTDENPSDELESLIQKKNDLINEKKNIAKTVRGKEKGEQMRKINLEISEIGRQISILKGQKN